MADEVDVSGDASGGLDRWESEIVRQARLFPYPPTPDLARRVQLPTIAASALPIVGSARRPAWAWGLVLLLAFCAALLTIAPVRAWVVEILQLGAVRIIVPPPPTALPRPTPLLAVLDMAGATTLEAAEKQLPFPMRLPAYPPDWELPDHVYVQNLDGPALVLVWMDPQQPGAVGASLHVLTSAALIYKMDPERIDTTTVHGREALWLQGPYIVQSGSGDWAPQRLVAGHVLVWTEGDLTYRLESDLSIEEAVRVAESLAPHRVNEP